MGKIVYAGTEIPVDDYVLAHLRVVIATKLRRGEGFFVSVPHSASDGRGRSAFWVAPGVSLRVSLSGPPPARLDRALIERLLHLANSNGGIADPAAEGVPADDVAEAG